MLTKIRAVRPALAAALLAAAGSGLSTAHASIMAAETALPLVLRAAEATRAPAHTTIMDAIETAALRSADPERTRGTLIARLTASPTCFPSNLTQEQYDAILRDWNFLPPGLYGPGGVVPRFNVDTQAWSGDLAQQASGRATRARFTYSFPADGTTWGLSAISATGPNTLNASFIAAFGASNLDRGREYLRQSFAAWNRYSGLDYQEVADAGLTMDQVTARRANVGDIRIGGLAFGTSAFLAYNAFPSATGLSGVGGSDMCINTSFFLGANYLNASNNYRYLRNTVSHEHGHGVGLIHQVPCDNTKMMEPFISTVFDVLTVDDRRAGGRNYGDRFAGNQSGATAIDVGNLTTPILTSVIERDLSTNGSAGFGNSDEDWFRFTIDSAQNVIISAVPTGGSYTTGQQSGGGCNGTTATINAAQAGNLNVELWNATGTGSALFTASSAAAGTTETLTLNNLAAGTYTARIVDVGPNANQTVQLYDLTIRVGASTAPPYANAGVNKRCTTGFPCFFMGNINSAPTETGSSLTNFDWDLDGDGTFETLNIPQPNFTYANAGDVNVTLRVTDTNGRTRNDTIVVTLVPAPTLTVDSVSPSSGFQGAIVPITITGTNLSGVTSSSQVTISGTGLAFANAPTVNGAGTSITGLSLIIGSSAIPGPRNITVNNGQAIGTGTGVFTVVATTGACCSGVTCSATTSGACTAANSSFRGAGSVCNVPGNNTTPCCRGDFSQNGVREPADIFTFLNAYFSADPLVSAQTDADGNGLREPADIFAYLNLYFAGGC